MLVDKYGSVDYEVVGVVTTKGYISLENNQFLKWTTTGKRLELWEGKKEYLDKAYLGNEDSDCSVRRIGYWNENSVLINGFQKVNLLSKKRVMR